MASLPCGGLVHHCFSVVARISGQDAKQQVLELEQTWVTAEHNHDAETLRRILDDKFVASFNADKPLDKDAFIKLMVTGDIDPTESDTLTDRNVILDNDTAVVVGVDTAWDSEGQTLYRGLPVYRDLHPPQRAMGRVS